MKSVAVILSGCGVYDGAEIGEAILTLLHISKNGATYQCFAPDKEQLHTVNHLTGEPSQDTRNVLVESARIARGDIKPLTDLDANEFDALILPGGFGAAKNLCDFAIKGSDASIDSDVKTAIDGFASLKKPVGYMCIAPAMIPFIHSSTTRFTIGNDEDTGSSISQIGGQHINCPVQDIIFDDTAKVVTTPAYMLANNLVEAEQGISKLVEKVLSLVD